MYISPKASRIRQREAQRARDNRTEIRKALASGQITRRDLVRWGIFTAAGGLALKNGLSPFAHSAFAAVPTGTPRSDLGSATKFSQRMPRLRTQTPIPLIRNASDEAEFVGHPQYPHAKRLSYHNDFNTYVDPATGQPVPAHENPFRNPLTDRGPMEGRPPGEFFAHQRWDQYFPKVGYVMSLGQCAPGTRFHPGMEAQEPNAIWCYGTGPLSQGVMAPPLIKGRYGEPILTRIYNNTPKDRALNGVEQNGGFGRNETQLHFHNAHNGAESDGATGAHHFPGTFYDYLWGTTLARRDIINTNATDQRAAGPDNGSGIVKVPGDWREIQGSMWAHDHRFFFTSENVYKGNLMGVNYYSGRDRGHETVTAGGNLRLPSGTRLGWGNVDFDVNLIVSDGATQEGQYFFDIFNTDGFLGDLPLVNFAYAPYFDVLRRKYRFRLLNASMSRFFKFALSYNGAAVPFKFIANDGNLVVNPITLTQLDEQAIAERYDIVVDFSAFPVGSRIYLVNLLRMRDDGRGPKETLSLAAALAGQPDDPVIGKIMEFRVVAATPSVDQPGVMLTTANSCGPNDKSQVPAVLTAQIPIVAPVRTRTIEYGRSGDDINGTSRDPVTGECTPDCRETATFPWSIKIDGEDAHTFNANRISLLIPQPGEVEHWTLVNGGGGWDHPIHLHFEEGVTIGRGDKSTGTVLPASIPATEHLARKDVWRLRPSGTVTFQVQFGEYGGSYVNHCHNTVHEDFAMLLRLQILAANGPQVAVTPTPIPTPDGVHFNTPEILPEGDPRSNA
jgi:FtsP/CotA-like multicopper oxidase with cupredoxin domain